MTSAPAGPPPPETDLPRGEVTVGYWAAARAAAGVASEQIPVSGPITLGELVAAVAVRHPDGRLVRVLDVCSVLVGDRPVASADRAEVWVHPGERVEFLPPFAGG